MLQLGKGSTFLGAVIGVAALALTTPALADKVLVYQNQNMEVQGADAAGPFVADLLEDLGHDVTREISLTAALPTDLSGFDTVWVVQVVGTTGIEQTTLVDYVKAGGGLYLTGDNTACCSGANSSIQNIINRLTPDVTRIDNGALTSDEWTAATDTWGITSTPNSVPTLLPEETSSMTMIPARNQVYKDAASDKIGVAAWTGEYLKEGGGCVVVNMDLSFWLDIVHPEIDKTPYTENVQHFLRTCADSDHDGVTDQGEEDAGTDPDSPDSDGDGLCDGYRAVAAVCVAGESVFANKDEDDLVDPLDEDDDGDGLPTSFELEAELAKPDADEYNDPAWLDIDSDNNNILDSVEGFTDHDGDGIPSIVDLGDDPENCDEDADCDVQPGSLGCNDETGFCEFPRQARPDGEGGAGSTPVTGGSPSATGGGAPATSGGAPGDDDDDDDREEGGQSNASEGGRNGDGASASSRDDGGCGCTVPGRTSNAAAALTLLALALVYQRRRHRCSGAGPAA